MSHSIKIGHIPIGELHPPFIIAEISANHNGSIGNAFRLIDAAVEAGASAVKLQTYRPDTITLDCNAKEFMIEEGLWAGQTLYELYASAFTPWEWHAELFAHARNRGITIFSSPFDHSAVDFLEDLKAPAYKIASFEAIDLPLIKYTASTGKPMIISTGMADVQEIEEAVDAARSAGCKELALLVCVSGYPAPASEYNLRTIADMRERFGCIAGLSDHTLGNTTAIAAVSVGASIIEKHFTLDRTRGGPDDSFSLEPKEFGELCRDTATAWKALGSVNYRRKSSEAKNVQFRRSIFVVEDMKAGEVFTAQNIRSIRPGHGIAPKFYQEVLGRVAKVDIKRGTPLAMTHF